MPTSMWNFNGKWEHLAGPDRAPWYFEPIPDPRVAGVAKPGSMAVINPYPQWMVFISNRTVHLPAILDFLDWSLEADPIRQQELNEGPLGINWFWTDTPLGEWDFRPEYAMIRNSEDPAVGAKLTPQLWMWGTYSNRWYPWFTNKVEGRLPVGFTKTRTFSQMIAGFGMTRTIHAYDNVTSAAGGLWERLAPALKAVRQEFEAKLLMAKDDAEFEKTWETYRIQLEQRVRWTDLKAEWNQAYRALIAQKGDY
jgi:putative aldouronate transport system substrate-binding protein